MFNALVLEESDGEVTASVQELEDDRLPDGNVVVDVSHSTINYKDGLAIMNRNGVVRSWPMVPGIDLAGTVASSTDDRYGVGDGVVLNGWGVGETHWGGLSQRARLQGDWLVPLPESFSAAEAMAIGTAGYTAMLCVLELEAHDITPDRGKVVVTGAAGGVGSVAIAILAKLGYEVVASTGRPAEADYLRSLGASEIIDRNELSEPGRPIGKPRWAGGVDAVGSHTLVNVLAQTSDEGCVAACGLAQGLDLPGTVAPFILRGVTLAGVNSVTQPRERRIEAWSRLEHDLDRDLLAQMTTTVSLAEVPGVAASILEGSVRGRYVVDVNS